MSTRHQSKANEPRFRNVTVAQLYLAGLIRTDQEITLHQSTTTDAEGTFYYVILDGALIGKGLTIDEAVSGAEDALTRREMLPGLF